MPTIIPHFAFPLRFDGSRHLATVEQDSQDEILSCVYIALKTPLGSRPYVPDFGVDDFLFTSPVPITELLDQIETSEPRASIDMAQEINDLIETIQVGVGNVG